MPIINYPYDTTITRKDLIDPYVMYLIVKESLNMSAGKIGAQCGHAVGIMYDYISQLWLINTQCHDESNQTLLSFQLWKNESYRKVVLRASDKEWEKIKQELDCFLVLDAGLTEIMPGETVIGLLPMRRSSAPKIIKRLQVL